MTSTILADRDDALELLRSNMGVDSPVVPDHVPDELTADHPDAATLVAAQRRRGGGVRVVSRGQQRPARARLVLAILACAVVAAFGDGGGPSTSDADAYREAIPVLEGRIETAPTTTPADACRIGIAAGHCDSSCAEWSLLTFLADDCSRPDPSDAG